MNENKITVKKVKNPPFKFAVLKRGNGNQDNRVLKMIVLEYPFTVWSDKNDEKGITIHTNTKLFMKVKFETADAKEVALNHLNEAMAGDDFEEGKPFYVDVFWDDLHEWKEREMLWAERKERWENCHCMDEGGCDDCIESKEFAVFDDFIEY